VDTPVLHAKSAQARDVENVMLLSSALEDAEGLIRKVALLEGELVEACQAQEVVEEKLCSLSDASANGARWIVASEVEHREQFEELSLLQAWGAELCLTVIILT
jgi:hypothetical protein